MVALLFLFIVVAPLIELYVIVQVAHLIGLFPTLALLVVGSAFGLWLVKREGFAVLRRVRGALDRGEMPTESLLDGALIAVAGVLCFLPGFVSDAFGLLLLVPPVRRFVRRRLVARWSLPTGPFSGRFRSSRIIDVEYIGDVTNTRDTGSAPAGELGTGREHD